MGGACAINQVGRVERLPKRAALGFFLAGGLGVGTLLGEPTEAPKGLPGGVLEFGEDGGTSGLGTQTPGSHLGVAGWVGRTRSSYSSSGYQGRDIGGGQSRAPASTGAGTRCLRSLCNPLAWIEEPGSDSLKEGPGAPTINTVWCY